MIDWTSHNFTTWYLKSTNNFCLYVNTVEFVSRDFLRQRFHSSLEIHIKYKTSSPFVTELENKMKVNRVYSNSIASLLQRLNQDFQSSHTECCQDQTSVFNCDSVRANPGKWTNNLDPVQWNKIIVHIREP